MTMFQLAGWVEGNLKTQDVWILWSLDAQSAAFCCFFSETSALDQPNDHQNGRPTDRSAVEAAVSSAIRRLNTFCNAFNIARNNTFATGELVTLIRMIP